MTAGHFGLAVGVKPAAQRVPLWALLVATYLLDIVFIGLVAAGVESFAPIHPGHPAYGQVVIHAYYSHSLVGAVLIAGAAGLAALPLWGRRGALVIAAVVLSHWVLDLVVHRADLPLLPGDVGGLPLLGFRLWSHPIVSAAAELLLVAGGVFFYFRSTVGAIHAETPEAARRRDRARLAVGVTATLLVLLALSDFLALSAMLGVLLMLLLIIVGGWLDARIGRPPAAAS